MTRARPTVAAALLAALLAAPAHPARAAGDDVATAQLLFDDGRKLMTDGHYADACPKLEESQRLAPAIGTEFNLADCWERVGRLASAWGAFLDVAEQTHKRAEGDRERAARSRAANLQPKLGRLSIDVPASRRVPGLELRRDGELLREALWGVGVPVDAGDHRVEARARGKRAWSALVRVTDGQPASVQMEELAPATPTPTPTPTSTSTATATPTPTSTTDPTPALIVLGGAVVLAGLGVLGLVEHDAKVSDYNADPTCPSIEAPTRPAACQDLVNTADTWKTLAIVGFVGSGVALATGVTLWVTAPRRTAPAATASLRCGPGFGSLVCAGAF